MIQLWQETGVFNTVLTSKSGNTLTSTATIESVSLQEDDGRSITCHEIFNSVISEQTRTVQVEGNCLNVYETSVMFTAGAPLAPSNVAIGAQQV